MGDDSELRALAGGVRICRRLAPPSMGRFALVIVPNTTSSGMFVSTPA